MKTDIGTRFRYRRVGVVVLALGVWSAATGANAQGIDRFAVVSQSVGVAAQGAEQRPTHEPGEGLNGVQAGSIGRAIETLRFDSATMSRVSRFGSFTEANARAAAQRRYRGGRRGDRGVAGLVLGAIGGFAAGGAIGVAVAEHSYHGTDPALHGFIIGAPIGAFVGGMLGYALAR